MHPRATLSLGNFLASGHFFLLIYIVAPYLAQFMPQAATGLIVSSGAVLSLIVFPYLPRLVRHFGARRLAVTFALAQALVLGLLAIGPTPLLAILAVAIACGISPLIAYQLDLLLEATIQQEGTTGRVRTLFLTAENMAVLIAPLIIGVLLDSGDNYGHVFLVAAASLIPFVLLFTSRNVAESSERPPPIDLHLTCSCMWKDRDLRATAFGMATLQFFYHLAPLYIPLYLHNVLGFPWEELGWVFALMLLPFVIIEYPAGWIADRWLGDKELLIAGFIITGSAFAAIASITAQTSLWAVLAILVLTRVGAALIESMIESHFFRRVSERDTATVGVFRMMRPVAALTAPIVGSAMLLFQGYSIFFLVTGAAIVAVGVISASYIRDIK